MCFKKKMWNSAKHHYSAKQKELLPGFLHAVVLW